MYEYAGRVLDWHDGDTCHVEVDLGLDIDTRLTIRLMGVNAPELATPEGKVALAYVRSLMAADGSVWLRTVKDHREKYGRYLAWVFLGSAMDDAFEVGHMLVASGNAVVYIVKEAP